MPAEAPTFEVHREGKRLLVALPYAKGGPARVRCGAHTAKLDCTPEGAKALARTLLAAAKGETP